VIKTEMKFFTDYSGQLCCMYWIMWKNTLGGVLSNFPCKC